MGQCASNKAKGNLSIKKIVSHKKIKKMEKHKQFREPKEDDTKPGWKEPNKPLDPNRKPPPKYTKGMSMSFGFKRRPTPMTSTNSAAAWDTGTTRSDANGNKDDPNSNSLACRSTANLHKIRSSHQQIQTASITPKPSRFGFPQTNTERTNKVADIKSNALPLYFGSAPPQSRPGSRRTSPNTEPDQMPSKTSTRNITVGTRTQIVETHEMVKNCMEQQPVVKERLSGELHTVKTGKFTFQTTKLPQPEPIRLIETKTAKTIANNNRRSARMLKLCEEGHRKIEPSNGDSGFGSNASGCLGDNDNVKSPLCLESNSENDSIQERLQGSKRFSLLENSDSFSDVSTPPPLPKLPSVFHVEKSIDTNKENECRNVRDDYIFKKTFLKSSTPMDTFLKSRSRNVLERDSSQSSSDQEWGNGGEAMADDDISLTMSPSRKHIDEKESAPVLKSGSVAEAVLQTFLQPSASFEMIDSLKASMNLTLSDEDRNFTAAVMNNSTGLLDDEMLSPLESLLSSSETEDIVKNKTARSSSNSKDVNEKLTPSPPGTPSNATYSLSLSDDKEDFLIDDEIADQPELVFEEGNNAERRSLSQFNQEDLVAMTQIRTASYNADFSPLPLRKKKNKLQDTSTNNQGSFDSMSPCDSIGSEDLIMDYDVSHANDIDLWDRQSGSFPSVEGTPKPKFKSDEASFNNKNGIKSTTPKHSAVTGTPTRRVSSSPNSLKSRISRRSSPESRSPRKSHFHPLGYQSMTYDPASESLTLTRHNHSAIQQDIIGIKTMLLTLRRVLNESESHNLLNNCGEELHDGTQSIINNNSNNNNNNSAFRFELEDLRRQVEFLQGQLEDREKTVSTLQKQICDLATQNTFNSLDNAPSHLGAVDTQHRCNAATQTERARPLSTGIFSLTASPIEDNNPILRLMVK